MLYTKKGDSGTTKLFNTPDGVRVPKTAAVFEALGTVDELVAFLGLAKVRSDVGDLHVGTASMAALVHSVQETLFVVQAELAGAGMSVSTDRVTFLETYTQQIEAILPPIKTFFIAGGTEGAAYFDVCRTVCRRMERTLLRAQEDGVPIADTTIAFANRLSSFLYAAARLFNHISGITETPPSYTQV